MREGPRVDIVCEGSKTQPHPRKFVVRVYRSIANPETLTFSHMVSYPIYNRETKELDQVTSGGGRPVADRNRDNLECVFGEGPNKCRVNLHLKRDSEARRKFNLVMKILIAESLTNGSAFPITLSQLATRL